MSTVTYIEVGQGDKELVTHWIWRGLPLIGRRRRWTSWTDSNGPFEGAKMPGLGIGAQPRSQDRDLLLVDRMGTAKYVANGLRGNRIVDTCHLVGFYVIGHTCGRSRKVCREDRVHLTFSTAIAQPCTRKVIPVLSANHHPCQQWSRSSQIPYHGLYTMTSRYPQTPTFR